MRTPIADSYWVIEGRFLAGEYPGTPVDDDTSVKLKSFIDLGVTAFIDLTEDGELRPYCEMLSSVATAAMRRTQYFRCPVRDLGVPTHDELGTILAHINQLLDQGEVIYVHCWGGIGRTGTVIGAYMVSEMNLSGQGALDRIAKLRQATPDGWRQSPETVEQRHMVLTYQNNRNQDEPVRIFVDVDDTLILYTGLGVQINWHLVEALTAGLDLGVYDVTVWSGTGTGWAKEWSEELFPGYGLPFGSKDDLWDTVPPSTFAIDDRLQSQREYLQHFSKVFLPMEFIDVAQSGELR